jgi:NAD(P)-dependent dehydrogenase (short-subunit alcohol dehydrogenase family)
LLDSASFDRMVDLHLKDVVVGLRLSLPYLYAAADPKVIVTSSIAGLVSNFRDPVYSAVKSARAGDRAGPRHEGVTITAVCPGGTLTGMMPPQFVDERTD